MSNGVVTRRRKQLCEAEVYEPSLQPEAARAFWFFSMKLLALWAVVAFFAPSGPLFMLGIAVLAGCHANPVRKSLFGLSIDCWPFQRQLWIGVPIGAGVHGVHFDW